MARYVTSPTGFNLIKAFEGFRATAAPLVGHGWVIGYGHTVSARKGTHISKSDASDLLTWDVKRLEAPLCDLIYTPLSQNQFDALVSLVFNIGLVNFKNSRILRRLNEGCPVDAAAGFDAWRRARLAGEVIVVDALVRRRAAEKALFLASPEESVIAPTPQLPPLCDAQMLNDHDVETPLKVMVDLHGTGETIVETPDQDSAHTEEKEAKQTATNPALVSLDDAFDSIPQADEQTSQDERPEADDGVESASPVAEIAEQIAGRLDAVAVEEQDQTDESVYQLTSADHLPEATEPDAEPEVKEEVEQEAPPLVDEDGILLEPYEPETQPDYTYDTGDTGVTPLVYDEPVYDEPDLDPQTLLTDGQVAPPSGEFQPAYDRGRIIFILMGVIGIAMTLGGLWQIQNTTSITTNLDLAKGPGQAFLGVLLWVVGAYYLLRRLNR